MKQLAGALSPSNFVPTNPELLRTTLRENGDNLVRGFKMLAEDVEAGHGDLKIRQTGKDGFEVGVNMATTPGKVVFRNHLIELIQYTPTTGKVLSIPLFDRAALDQQILHPRPQSGERASSAGASNRV